MADTLQFDLVSPERKLASLEATQVQLPGMNGDFAAMPNHAPFLTTLRPGVVRIHAGGQTTEYLVTGGFAEVSGTSASVLAERAAPLAEANAEMLSDVLSEAERAREDAANDAERQAADLRVRDISTLRSQLSL